MNVHREKKEKLVFKENMVKRDKKVQMVELVDLDIKEKKEKPVIKAQREIPEILEHLVLL